MTSHDPEIPLLGVRRTINLHTWPGRGKPKPPNKARPKAERLSAHPGLVLVAAAARYGGPERWGLGVALRFVGRSVTGVFLVVEDEATAKDPALRRWARRQRVRTPEGNQRVEVITRPQLCRRNNGVLTTTCYGTGWLFTADEGRTLGLLAEHHAAARRKGFEGGFNLGLPGWGERSEELSSWRCNLHRPNMSAKALGAHGLRVEFAPAGRGGYAPDKSRAGKWERVGNRWLPYRGRIGDLIGPAFAFDGIDTSDLSEHLEAFGLPALTLPAAVSVDPAGATELFRVARAVHGLAVVLDDEAARWFTTAEEQRQGRSVVGLRQLLSSPGSLATHALRRAGLSPPLVKFATPNDSVLDRYAAAGHGGWSTGDIRGILLPVSDIDVRSAYPAAFVLLDCWRVLRASRLREVDATAELRRLAERAAAGDLSPLLDPATYARFGLTLAEVRCDGEPWPVELPLLDDTSDSRFYVAETYSDIPLNFVWPDVLAAAARSGRVPDIVSATRLVPVGTERVRPLPLCEGVVVAPGDDPMAAGIRLRTHMKDVGGERLVTQLRVFLNSLAAGVFGRLDLVRDHGQLVELPAEWSWPPIASTVPAVARMWLALADTMAKDSGAKVVTRDTDGAALTWAPHSDLDTVPRGQRCKVRPVGGISEIAKAFALLNVWGDGTGFWKVESGTLEQPLHMVSLGRKRYVTAYPNADGSWHIVGGTEHSLGGGVVDPPALRGRDGNRRHIWTYPVAEHVVAVAIARGKGQSPPAFVAPWDPPGVAPFPVLRRFSAASPGILRGVPKELGAHPFAPLVEAQPDPFVSGHAASPVALDPGTDLAEWSSLFWFDRVGALDVTTTKIPSVASMVRLRTLRDFAEDWSHPVAHDDPGPVVVEPRLTPRVGRSGALIDARLADPTASTKDYQIVVGGGDVAGFVAEMAGRLGPRPFERRTGVSRSAALRAKFDRSMSPRNQARAVRALQMTVDAVRCTLAGCEELVPRPNALYCCRAHSDAAYRQRKRTRVARPLQGPSCAQCGSLMFGGAVGRRDRCTDCEEKGDKS